MKQVKVGMANINTTVGAFESNTNKIKEASEKMYGDKCDIGCFQEMVISGYPAEDLVLWDEYIRKQRDCLSDIMIHTQNMDTYFIIGLAYNYNGLVYNAAALIGQGELIGVVPKEELPTYDVFYDGRQFTPGLSYHTDLENKFGDFIFDFPWGKTAIAIREDMWTSGGPIPRRSFSGAELIFNLSASPWRHGVTDVRENILKTRSDDNQIALVYVNQFGGNDSLVFDGGSLVAQNGDIVCRTPRWQESVSSFVINMDNVRNGRKQNTTWRNSYNSFIQQNKICETIKIENPNIVKSYEYPEGTSNLNTCNYFMPEPEHKNSYDPEEESINAIVTGLNDYYCKTGVFNGIGVALSGGRDSVLTAILASEWARRTNRSPKIIKCFSMPSRFNSEATKSIAYDIAMSLKASFVEIPIQEAFENEIDIIKSMTLQEDINPVTLQNMQARIRGMRMWNVSNELGLLWLQSGNMSEKSVGYTTIGGDMMGGYSLLGNMPKTVVNKILLGIANRKYPELSENVEILLQTDASAELADDQKDERDLMPFEILDLCYWLFVKEKKCPQDIYNYLCDKFTDQELLVLSPNYTNGKLKNWVVRFIKLFFRSIYKWTQTPQAVHMGPIDLDRERALQIPVVQSIEWMDLNIQGDR